MKLRIALIAVICTTLPLSLAHAQDKFVYVKKATREETLKASLAASGAASWGSEWHVIGPFENTGIGQPHPPEQKVDLAARYPGKGGEVTWKKAALPEGKINDLKPLFKVHNDSVCYLYKQIDSPQASTIRVSLGSDDSLKLFVNGKAVIEKDVVRPAAADQDLVNVSLNPGKNDLMLKIGNIGGDWAFYFRPDVAAELHAALQRKIDADFPPAGEGAHYRIVTIPLPEKGELLEGGGLVFRPDGKLYLATRRGDIWLVENPLAEDPSQVKFKPFARGLHEVLGLTLVNGKDLYLVQRPEITLIRDTNGDDVADEFTTINDKFGLSGDYHEYIFGPARDKEGNFFVSLNVGFGGGHQAKVPYRGFCLKVTPQGKMIPWAYGLRSPNGINFAPDGRLYYTDNQGEWVATCKMHEIRQGEFYGHMASVRWWEGKKDGDRPEMTPPVIWFPYHMSKSTTEPIWDTTAGKFGPFAGQAIIGDLTNSLLMRAHLEEVQGRMQGAVFQFRTGFQSGVNRLTFAPDGTLFVAQTNRGWGSVGGQPHGLQRVIYTGRLPFEMHAMKVTPTGWDVTFTKPVSREQAEDLKNYFLESYTYHHWGTYGSPEIERKENEITAIKVSEDGKTVSLTVPQRDTRRVYHLQLKNFQATDTSELLHKDAYYTLNNVP